MTDLTREEMVKLTVVKDNTIRDLRLQVADYDSLIEHRQSEIDALESTLVGKDARIAELEADTIVLEDSVTHFETAWKRMTTPREITDEVKDGRWILLGTAGFLSSYVVARWSKAGNWNPCWQDAMGNRYTGDSTFLPLPSDPVEQPK